MNDNHSFDDLMARLQAGSDTAASHVFHLYAQRLIALARSRLNARTRQKVDPEDVVQSVFRSFFTRQASGEYDLGNGDRLWGLLASITINKCINQVQRFRTVRRKVDAEVADTGAAWDFIDREPTAEAAAILTETMHEMMRGLDETDRKIVEMRLQGYAYEEIKVVGVSLSSVRRVITRVKKRLQRIHSADNQV